MLRLTAETLEGTFVDVGVFECEDEVEDFVENNASWVKEWRGYSVKEVSS